MSSIARLTPANTTLASPLAAFRASHGDPITWSATDFDAWLTTADTQAALDTRPLAGADDACPMCGYWQCRCLTGLEFDSPAGQDALRDIVTDLAQTAQGDVDQEDLAHYRGLLHPPVTRLTVRRTENAARGWAA